METNSLAIKNEHFVQMRSLFFKERNNINYVYKYKGFLIVSQAEV